MSGRLYVFAGGGTGGHLFPGIAVADRLVQREPDARIRFLGTDRSVEREILSKTGYDHVPLVREGNRRLWSRIRNLASGYRSALDLMRKDRPAAVIGCGGGASVAPILTARRLRVPVFLLEQNVIPGRTTRLLARLGTSVCLTYPESATLLSKSARIRVTGNPVRQLISDLSMSPFPIAESPHQQTLLVLGGSQGAHSINDTMIRFAEHDSRPLDGWRVIHQTGPTDAEVVRAVYGRLGLDALVESFFDDMVPHYRNSDMVVSRSGGTTLSELACAGLPALLVPYPFAKDDHQTANANIFVQNEAADLIPTLNTEDGQKEFMRILGNYLSHPELRLKRAQHMRSLARPRAAEEIASLVISEST